MCTGRSCRGSDRRPLRTVNGRSLRSLSPSWPRRRWSDRRAWSAWGRTYKEATERISLISVLMLSCAQQNVAYEEITLRSSARARARAKESKGTPEPPPIPERFTTVPFSPSRCWVIAVVASASSRDRRTAGLRSRTSESPPQSIDPGRPEARKGGSRIRVPPVLVRPSPGRRPGHSGRRDRGRRAEGEGPSPYGCSRRGAMPSRQRGVGQGAPGGA